MRDAREFNFDGLVGPSHNYAGLSLGNLAATAHAGEVSYPRAAALFEQSAPPCSPRPPSASWGCPRSISP